MTLEGINMNTYTVTSSCELRLLCIKNDWFTAGSNEQYNKLFYANSNGCSIEEIATIIWLCSSEEHARRDIMEKLKEAQAKYKEECSEE